MGGEVPPRPGLRYRKTPGAHSPKRSAVNRLSHQGQTDGVQARLHEGPSHMPGGAAPVQLHRERARLRYGRSQECSRIAPALPYKWLCERDNPVLRGWLRQQRRHQGPIPTAHSGDHPRCCLQRTMLREAVGGCHQRGRRRLAGGAGGVSLRLLQQATTHWPTRVSRMGQRPCQPRRETPGRDSDVRDAPPRTESVVGLLRARHPTNTQRDREAQRCRRPLRAHTGRGYHHGALRHVLGGGLPVPRGAACEYKGGCPHQGSLAGTVQVAARRVHRTPETNRSALRISRQPQGSSVPESLGICSVLGSHSPRSWQEAGEVLDYRQELRCQQGPRRSGAEVGHRPPGQTDRSGLPWMPDATAHAHWGRAHSTNSDGILPPVDFGSGMGGRLRAARDRVVRGRQLERCLHDLASRAHPHGRDAQSGHSLLEHHACPAPGS